MLLANGIAQAESRDYKGAIPYFDKAIQLKPTDPKAYLERSKARRELGDARGAAQDLEDFKIMFDRLEEGLKANDAAGAAYDSGDYKGAVKHYNRAISLLPSLTCIYYHRGTAKQCLGDYDAAVEDFSKSIDANASNKADAYHQRAKIKFHKLNDADGAVQDLNEAIELCPNDADLFFSRATISSEYDALQDLNRAIELSPTNAELCFYRALRRHDMEDVEGAIQDLTRFINMDSSDTDLSVSEAYALRGSMKQTLCDFPGALRDHNQAMATDASQTMAYFHRGVTKHSLHDFEGAILDFGHAIALDPSNGLAFHFRGLARLAVGLQSEAEKDFEDARSLGYNDNGT